MLQRGLPVLIAGSGGAHLIAAQVADKETIRRALDALLNHLSRFEHRVTVETRNDKAVLENAGRSILEATGFYRNYPTMVWKRRW